MQAWVATSDDVVCSDVSNVVCNAAIRNTETSNGPGSSGAGSNGAASDERGDAARGNKRFRRLLIAADSTFQELGFARGLSTYFW